MIYFDWLKFFIPVKSLPLHISKINKQHKSMKSCAINQEIGSRYLRLSFVREYLQWRELEYACVNTNHLKSNSTLLPGI